MIRSSPLSLAKPRVWKAGLLFLALANSQPLKSQDAPSPPANITQEEVAQKLSDLTQAISQNPKNPLNYYNRGVAELEAAAFNAVIAFRPWTVSTPPPPTPEQAAAFKAETENTKAAIADFSKAIELNPKYGEAYHQRGVVEWSLINKGGGLPGAQLAKDDLHKALAIDPSNEGAWKSLAEAEGDYKKSVEDYSKAIALAPKDASAYASRARFEGFIWNYDGALKDYAQAIRLDPKELQFYHERAEMEVMLAQTGVGKWNDAIPDLTQEISLNPGEPSYYMYRAVAKSNLGDFKGALHDYDQKLHLSPDDYMDYTRRGDIKIKLGDVDGAISDYSEAIKLVPSYAAAIGGLNAAEKLKDAAR